MSSGGVRVSETAETQTEAGDRDDVQGCGRDMFRLHEGLEHWNVGWNKKSHLDDSGRLKLRSDCGTMRNCLNSED